MAAQNSEVSCERQAAGQSAGSSWRWNRHHGRQGQEMEALQL